MSRRKGEKSSAPTVNGGVADAVTGGEPSGTNHKHSARGVSYTFSFEGGNGPNGQWARMPLKVTIETAPIMQPDGSEVTPPLLAVLREFHLIAYCPNREPTAEDLATAEDFAENFVAMPDVLFNALGLMVWVANAQAGPPSRRKHHRKAAKSDGVLGRFCDAMKTRIGTTITGRPKGTGKPIDPEIPRICSEMFATLRPALRSDAATYERVSEELARSGRHSISASGVHQAIKRHRARSADK